MAERMVRQLVDDLDGTAIDDGSGERVVFSVRGATYQIDLSSANARKLDKALKPFIDAALPIRRDTARTEQTAELSSTPRQNSASKADRNPARSAARNGKAEKQSGTAGQNAGANGDHRKRVRKTSARARTAQAQPSVIREWARQNGYKMMERGRISSEIVEAFKAAN
ncbi:Lsr2 family protein [Mycobacterium sp. 3519A]|uniref:histone-like nucleoid-structuring protein Lsr2 n=1 Tax=Mycobacterium sp. 3519A TaxID=2057184 RepID=UPI0011577DEF|nr:Lsr2 family protein [Mycobacterium sp. 3519A]